MPVATALHLVLKFLFAEAVAVDPDFIADPGSAVDPDFVVDLDFVADPGSAVDLDFVADPDLDPDPDSGTDSVVAVVVLVVVSFSERKPDCISYQDHQGFFAMPPYKLLYFRRGVVASIVNFQGYVRLVLFLPEFQVFLKALKISFRPLQTAFVYTAHQPG